MLFWVTMRGRERIFSKPRDSAIVKMVSRRTLLSRVMKLMPLVGQFELPKFEKSGMAPPPDALPVPESMYLGAPPVVAVIGEVPTLLAPPTAVALLPHPKPT